MNKLQIGLALVVVICITGCATQTKSQQQFHTMHSNFEAASWKARNCKSAVEMENTGLINDIEALLILYDQDPQAIQKMSIKRNMTDPEKAQLLEYREKMLPCESEFIEGLASVHPDAVAHFSELYANRTKDMVALITDKKTIGEYNSDRFTAIVKEKADIVRLQRNIGQQYSQAHKAEIANRQAADAALQQWLYQQQLLQQNQQMINSLNRPTVMNCSYSGGGMMRCIGQ